MTAVVIRGDAARLPLPDGSVDLIVTSPPYFALRSYSDTALCLACIDLKRDGRDPRQAFADYDAHVAAVHRQHYAGQIGSEATPQEWVAALVACTREWMRVLKPSGSIFVNLGDKYNSAASGQNGHLSEWSEVNARGGSHKLGRSSRRTAAVSGVGPKSLLGLPWRYAIGCTDRLGLILRRDIIWAKPNGLPESVTDRCRSSHEYLFHLVKQPRYYSAVDEIREAASGAHSHGNGRNAPERAERRTDLARLWSASPLGKLPGSVWEIPSQPLTVPAALGVDHFAAFPMELPRRCILGWSPPGICVECGEGRRPVSSKGEPVLRAWSAKGAHYTGSTENGGHHGENSSTLKHLVPVTITGYACACPEPDAPTRPAVVLDPFGGTGTTALVASVLGRVGVTVDRSGDYCRLAAWRVRDPGERARALGVPKPPPVPDGQMDLFDMDAIDVPPPLPGGLEDVS